MPSIMAGLPNHLIMRIIREHTTQKNLDYHISRMKNAPARLEFRGVLFLPLIHILWSDPELKKETPEFWMKKLVLAGQETAVFSPASPSRNAERCILETRVSGETLRNFAFGLHPDT